MNDRVSDYSVSQFYDSACKLDSSSVVDCLTMTPLSTSACEMNNVNSVQIAPQSVAVPQMKFSDAALNVTISETKEVKTHFHISCYLKGRHRTVKVAAMVDSGATALFIDKKYADSQKMWQVPLEHPIRLYNIDGTLNEAGSITHKVKLRLRIGEDEEQFKFYNTSLGPEKVILGLPWLRHRNPRINWQEGTMSLNTDQGMGLEPFKVEVTKIAANRMEHHCLLHEGVLETHQDEVYCLAGFMYTQQIAEQASKAKGKKMFEEMVPEYYRDFAKVFSEEESQWLPEHQPWDHAIDLEPDVVKHWKIKSYPMSANEQEELDKILKEHISKAI